MRFLRAANNGPPTKDMGIMREMTPPGFTRRRVCSRNRAYRFTYPSVITGAKHSKISFEGRNTRPYGGLPITASYRISGGVSLSVSARLIGILGFLPAD